MQTLPDTFAVFILTHGRPDNVITYKTLQKCGYTGRLYFVVDDEDKTVDRYIERFGKDRVIVFDKKAEADACDEGNNFDERRTITMARNACFGIAERLGITHFLELDDDYQWFGYRYNRAPGLKTHPLVKSIDQTILAFLRFFELSGCSSIAFSQGGDFIGGYNDKLHKRKCMNSFFCSTQRPFRFIGAMNEDVNTYTTLGCRGDLFLTFMPVQLVQKNSQQQGAGITDMYLKFGTYCKAFTTVMMMPGSVKVSMMGIENPRIHHSINWKATVPCILREKHRKTDGNKSLPLEREA